jgi:hypothetical protein
MEKGKRLNLVNSLGRIGFRNIDDSFYTNCNLLFYKVIKNKYCLTLGLDKKSTYVKGFYGANYYLSKKPSWSNIASVPTKAYQPVGPYLSAGERKKLLPSEFQKPGMVAAQWQIFSQADIDNFIESIMVTEDDFLNQEDLLMEIDSNEKLKNEMCLICDTISLVQNKTHFSGIDIIPVPKHRAKVSIEWYKASAYVAAKIKKVDYNFIEMLAVDSFRQQFYPGLLTIAECLSSKNKKHV